MRYQPLMLLACDLLTSYCCYFSVQTECFEDMLVFWLGEDHVYDRCCFWRLMRSRPADGKVLQRQAFDILLFEFGIPGPTSTAYLTDVRYVAWSGHSAPGLQSAVRGSGQMPE